MKRALIVIVVALLIASVSGVNDASLALEQEAAQATGAHEREIAARVSRIGVNRVVRIERADGSRSNAVLEDVLPDAIVVTILEGQDRRRETIPFAEIEKDRRGARARAPERADWCRNWCGGVGRNLCGGAFFGNIALTETST